jgi:hypothetical protein
MPRQPVCTAGSDTAPLARMRERAMHACICMRVYSHSGNHRTRLVEDQQEGAQIFALAMEMESSEPRHEDEAPQQHARDHTS